MSDRILVVSDFTGNVDKIELHVEPLSEVVAETTMVCITPDPEIDAIDYRTVPSFGVRPLELVVLFAVALVEGIRNEYDGIVCFSLLPYGLFGLCLRPIARASVHLGVLGGDVDVHADSWYGPAVRAAFRRFDVVSVPGETHKRRLVRMGVEPRRIAILTNAIDCSVYRPPSDPVEPTYDFVWAGRFASEKDPLSFVRALADVRDRGHDFDAVMLGDGPLEGDVRAEIETVGLSDAIEVAGWVEEPVEYYHQSRILALTSNRDALPLSLLEAMATGLACVTPAVGNVDDVVDHRENGLLLSEKDGMSFADAFEVLLCDASLRDRLGESAAAVGTEFSYDRAREDWTHILTRMDGRRNSVEITPPWHEERADG